MAVMIIATGLAYYKVIKKIPLMISCLLYISVCINELFSENHHYIITLLFKIAHLEVNPHPISMLDDLLLFICIPSFFLYTFFKIAPELSGYMTPRPETLFSTILVVRGKNKMLLAVLLEYFIKPSLFLPF